MPGENSVSEKDEDYNKKTPMQYWELCCKQTSSIGGGPNGE